MSAHLANLGGVLENKFLFVVRFHSDRGGEDKSNGTFHCLVNL